jgi:hypothetical protein
MTKALKMGYYKEIERRYKQSDKYEKEQFSTNIAKYVGITESMQ